MYYTATFGIASGLNLIVVSEYSLLTVFNNNVVYAAQIGSYSSALLYITRVFIGNPIMGGVSDSLGRRPGFVVSTFAWTFAVASFYMFPSIPMMLFGSFLQGCLTPEPITQSFCADLTTTFTMTDQFVTNKSQVTSETHAKKKEEMTVQEQATFRDQFAKKSAKLIASILATYTFSLAVGAVVGSILSIKEEEESKSSNSTSNSFCDDEEEEEEEDAGGLGLSSADDASHLDGAFKAAIFMGFVCLGVTCMMGAKGDGTKHGGGNVTKIDEFDPRKAWLTSMMYVKDVMWPSTYVRSLCVLLFVSKSLEYGALGIFYFYGKWQFGWKATDYGIFVVVILFANAFANTVMVSE